MFYIVDEGENKVIETGSDKDEIMNVYISLMTLHPEALLVLKEYHTDEVAMACDGDSEPITDWDYSSPQP